MKQNKTFPSSTHQDISLCIKSLDDLLKGDHVPMDIYGNVQLQLQMIEHVAYQICEPLNEGRSFDELFNLVELQNWYWLQMLWPLRDSLNDLVAKHGNKTLDIAETAYFTHKAPHCESAEKWWFDTLDDVTIRVAGNLAWQKLVVGVMRASEANKLIYEYGGFQPFDGHWKKFGLDGSGEANDDVVRQFITKKWNYPIDDLKWLLSREEKHRYTSVGKRYDRTTNYLVKVFERVQGFMPRDALKMLYDGSLRNFIAKRAADRMKDHIEADQRQKRGGRGPAEMGKKVKELREQKCMSRTELAHTSGYSPRTIKTLEEGKGGKIWPKQMEAIANALEVDSDIIMGGTKTILTDFQEKDELDDERTIRIAAADQLNAEDAMLFKELEIEILNEFSTQTPEYKILKAALSGVFDGTNKGEFAEKISINDRTLRKKMEALRGDKRLLKHLNKKV